MKQNLIALVSGLLFGAGLAISGMADPARVQAFLDLFGAWDPTLAFVMGGAMIPMALAWPIQRRLSRPVACDAFYRPGPRLGPRKLRGGAGLSGGCGGTGGLCPGPAVADLAIEPGRAAVFVVAMLAGMIGHRMVTR